MMSGNIFGFFGGSGETYLGSAFEIIEDSPPFAVLAGASTVALVNDDEIEKTRRELLENVFVFLSASESLIEGEVDFV
jgi:hypothetical protein